MTLQEFVYKWSRIQLKETVASQPLFNDICRLFDTSYKKRLKQRTLTNLYNGLVYFRESKETGKLWSQDEFAKVTRKSVTRNEIQELDDIHQTLDESVLDAYGWPHELSD